VHGCTNVAGGRTPEATIFLYAHFG
jgi:hypothetical protein